MSVSETAFRRRDGVDTTAVDGELFVVRPDTHGIFHLNAVGTALWSLLAEPCTRAEATTVLASAFPDVPAPELEADVRRFFEHLEWCGLIAPVSSEA